MTQNSLSHRKFVTQAVLFACSVAVFIASIAIIEDPVVKVLTCIGVGLAGVVFALNAAKAKHQIDDSGTRNSDDDGE